MQYLSSILLIFTFILTACQTENKKINNSKIQVLESYIDKFKLSNDPYFGLEYIEGQTDSLYRYTWNLDSSNIEMQLNELFKEFAYRFTIDTKLNNFLLFDLVMDKQSRIHQIGFFDESDKFTGKIYDYNIRKGHIFKEYHLQGQRFYEIFYQIDDFGNIFDSSYQYFPLVVPNNFYFEGPELSICFEIQLIIHKKNYNFEDFHLWHQFYDLEDTYDLKDKVDDSLIYSSDLIKSKDGLYKICHDLEVSHHLMPVFGIFVSDGVSNQDLTFGEMKTPIINKNIDSMEL